MTREAAINILNQVIDQIQVTRPQLKTIEEALKTLVDLSEPETKTQPSPQDATTAPN